MLIQNISSMAQFNQPVGLAGNGAPNVAAAVSNVQAPPSATLEMPQTAVKPVAEQSLSTAQLQGVVDSINKALKQSNKNLEFSLDPESNRSIMRLVDSETGDVIRQFPSEDAIAISKAIDRMQQGMLLKQEA